MARGKRKVAERDYEKLISSTKEYIEKLEIKSVEIREELKSKKDELKKLEKDGLVIGKWDDPKKKFQKIYYLTD